MMPLLVIKRKALVIGGTILLLALLGGGYYAYNNHVLPIKPQNNPVSGAESEVKEIVQKVGKFVELPKDEQPSIATVSDKEKLKDQQFFVRAENGDKVLIYTKANRAILYRPKTGKIIEMAPVNISTPEASGSATTNAGITKPLVTVKVAILNGTTKAGLAKTAEKDLNDKSAPVEVVVKDNAKKGYDKTVIVDISGNAKDQTTALASLMNAQIGTLPDGEDKPSNAEIVIFLGTDYIK